MPASDRIPAVILAGGASRRMGGGDKCLLPLAGKTMLARVIERLTPQSQERALNANGDTSRFAQYGLPILHDRMPDRPGPLAGVLAAMEWASDLGADKVLTVAADTPFFPRDLADRLAEVSTAPVVLAATADPETGRVFRHPTFGLWDVALRHDLERALGTGVRKIVAWTDQHGAESVLFDSPGGRDPFFNVNTPDDLASAEVRARGNRLFGVTGWKNSGKTGLVERLVAEITSRGFRVSTVKHAHHSFDIDHPGRDSHRHRAAGAEEVLLVSRNRWALMHELRGQPEPDLETLLEKLDPVDLVIVEGFKSNRHPKIEAHRNETGQPLIAPDDETIQAVASDTPAVVRPHVGSRAVFDLDDTKSLADFVVLESGLS